MDDERRGGIGIAELARRAGVTPRTIRYYVTEGLLPALAGQGQRRAYGQVHLDRLETIRELKAAYLPLHEIRRRLGDDLALGGRNALRRYGRGAGTEDAGRLGLHPDGDASCGDAMSSATRPIGFGPSQDVSRIEIYEPTETAWRRHVLAQGVELHVQETDDPKLAEAIQRLLREAAAILDGKPTR
jgi:DNA-binding transcriptional MerR regulator